MVGLASAVAVDVLIPVSAYRLGSSRLVFSYLPMGVLLVLGAVVAGLNVVLGAIRRSWALTSAEPAVVFAMTLVASAFPALGFVGYLLGIIGTPYYSASPENQWGELLLPHLPEWAPPPEGSGALEWFYNGLPPGRSIPWSAWVVPLCGWGRATERLLPERRGQGDTLQMSRSSLRVNSRAMPRAPSPASSTRTTRASPRTVKVAFTLTISPMWRSSAPSVMR